MKRLIIFIVLGIAIFITTAHLARAQLTLPQGGLGTSTVPQNWFLIGSSATRLTASSTIAQNHIDNAIARVSALSAYLPLSVYFASTTPKHITSLPNLTITESQISDLQAPVTLAGTPDYITIAGQVITRGLIDLATDVTGVLPDANVSDTITLTNITQITNRAITDLTGTLTAGNGGTGSTTLSGILKGNGTGAVQTAVLGTDYSNFGPSVGPTELLSTDFGEFTCNGTTCSLDADTVSDSEIDYSTVTLGDFTNDASYAQLSSAMTGTFDGNNFAGGAIGAGDLIYGASAGSLGELTLGASSTALVSNGTLPAWNKLSIAYLDTSGTSTFSGGISAARLEATATSTFAGVVVGAGGLKVPTIPNCNTVDTDASGTFICGTDALGAGGGAASVGTSSLEVANQVAVFSTTGASPALIRGDTGFTFEGTTDTLSVAGKLGIATSTPYAALSVNGEIVGASFTGTTTATSTLGGGLAAIRLSATATSTFAGLQISTGGLTIGTMGTGLLKSTSGAIGLALSGTDYSNFGPSVGPTELLSTDFGDFTCNGTTCDVDANAIALGTDTINNYVATIADDGQSTITVNNSGAENAAVTLRVVDVVCTDCLGATEIADTYLLNTGDDGVGTYTFTGNVGVGTTSPYAKLSVVGEVVASHLTGTTTATSTLGGGLLATRFSTTATSTMAGINLTSGCFSINGVCIGGAGGSGTVNTGTTGQTAYYQSAGTAVSGTSTLFISTAGRVGVGTTTPAGILHVYRDSTSGVDPLGVYSHRKVTGTATQNGVHNYLAESSGVMADGFGPAAFFLAKDTDNVDNILGYLSFIRSGADNTGMFAVFPETGGATDRGFFVNDDGDMSGSALLIDEDGTVSSGSASIPDGSLIVGDGSDTGTFELEDGPACIGDGGCTPSAFDGTLSVFGTASSTFSGALGIGTTSPFALLTVTGGAILNTESVVSTSTSISLNFAASTQHLIQIANSATTITIKNFYPGMAQRVMVCNPASGTAGAVTWATSPAGRLLWNGGAVPTQTTTLNKCDLWTFAVTQATSSVMKATIFGSQISNY